MTSATRVRRPIPVTILSVLLFIASLLLVLDVFTGDFSRYGILFSPYMILHVLGLAAVGTSLWNMERWGLLVFIVLLVMHTAVFIFAGVPLLYLLCYVPVLAAFIYWPLLKKPEKDHHPYI